MKWYHWLTLSGQSIVPFSTVKGQFVSRQGLNGLQKTNGLYCHSERSEESISDLSIKNKQREILRFAQKDIVLSFYAACKARAI
jgi:hypothetical protein